MLVYNVLALWRSSKISVPRERGLSYVNYVITSRNTNNNNNRKDLNKMTNLLFSAWFLALLLVAPACQAAWSSPIKLKYGPKTSEVTFPEMYIDPSSKVTHAFWIDNQDNNYRLAYARISSDRKVSTPVLLETAHRARLSHIIGPGDGKHILLAYDGKREQGDRDDCGNGQTKGCYEIFFRESKDGGETWSAPEMVAHDSPNDEKDRKGPRIIYVKETGQVFLTYWCSGSMAHVTRRSGESKFSRETLFPFGATTAYQSIVYTISSQKPLFHFIYVNWSYPYEYMMYSASADEGRTWSTPKQLITNVHHSTADSYFRPYAVANQDRLANSIYVTFILNNEVKIMWSKNDGATWSPALPTHKGNAVAPRIQVCPAAAGNTARLRSLFALRKPENGNSFIFGTLDSHSYKMEKEQPFAGYTFNWAYLVDCYVEGEKEVVAAIVESYAGDTNEIFLRYNDALGAEED